MEIQNEVVTTLMKARDIIKNGWCQGDYQDGNKYCVLGALRAAAGETQINRLYVYDDVNQTYRDSLTVLHSCCNTQFLNTHDIFEWNDADGRTQQEVIELFDKAIEKEMSKCSISS